MTNVVLFSSRARLEAAASSELPASREVIDWCLMILQQTDETELDIPLSRAFSQQTLYEVICEFKNRGWTVTTCGARQLHFRLA